jgi:hypothetical protein
MSRRWDISRADEWFAGEDKALELTVLGGVNITGWALEHQVRRSAFERGAPLLRHTTADGSIQIIDGPGGVARIMVLGAQTADLAEGTYFHVVWRTDAGNNAVLAFGDAVIQRAGVP